MRQPLSPFLQTLADVDWSSTVIVWLGLAFVVSAAVRLVARPRGYRGRHVDHR